MLTACGIETHKCCNYTKNCYVATVLTACGIETSLHITCCGASQQVATVLTACGIETYQIAPFERAQLLLSCNSAYRLRYWNKISLFMTLSSLLWISCNSAYRLRYWNPSPFRDFTKIPSVATVLTARGIETAEYFWCADASTKLQQCLPLAVLKLAPRTHTFRSLLALQQCLPLAVLKRS